MFERMSLVGVGASLVAAVFQASAWAQSDATLSIVDQSCVIERVKACIVSYTADEDAAYDAAGAAYVVQNKRLSRVTQPNVGTPPIRLQSSRFGELTGDKVAFLFTPGFEVHVHPKPPEQPANALFGSNNVACRVGYQVTAKLGKPPSHVNIPWEKDGNPCVRAVYRQSVVFDAIHHYCKIDQEYVRFDSKTCLKPGPSPKEVWDFMTKHHFESLKTVIQELKK